MNIQIFGKNKCFATKKAERYFKERGIKYQRIDLIKYGMSPKEFQSVMNIVGFDNMVDWNNPDTTILRYLAGNIEKQKKLLENPKWIKTPVVRNGSRNATVGYCPEIWKTWK